MSDYSLSFSDCVLSIMFIGFFLNSGWTLFDGTCLLVNRLLNRAKAFLNFIR